MQGTTEGDTAVDTVGIFLCGDVMTGRGIDQALPHPSDPVLYECWVKDARDYVSLAEEAHGPLSLPLGFADIWGDALEELACRRPDLRIVNLETSITRSADPWPEKGIHYRMNPENVPCLTAAAIDCCVLSNNHVLDWGLAGLSETLRTLSRAGIGACGAGESLDEAAAPAVLDVRGGGRVLVFGVGSSTSGIPDEWAARPGCAGVWLLPRPEPRAVPEIAARIAESRKPGDLVVLSVHWGGNWGYSVPSWQSEFAHRLVDEAGVDVVHGHSSHHPKAIEVYHGRLVLYGCGDLLTDYEGITGYEEYRGDLSLMYFARLERRSGALAELRMSPMRMRRFRVSRACPSEAQWLFELLRRETRPWKQSVERQADGSIDLLWR
jgi:poly-gamma-glutamate synthesis protein (capsule biosynthesis protein)